jgi:hypothetical protein
MRDAKPSQGGWIPWSADQAVEYQIADDFLRVRRWDYGAARISGWTKWQRSTEETIRKQLRELEWDLLPKHVAQSDDVGQGGGWKAQLSTWLRNHFVAG